MLDMNVKAISMPARNLLLTRRAYASYIETTSSSLLVSDAKFNLLLMFNLTEKSAYYSNDRHFPSCVTHGNIHVGFLLPHVENIEVM